MIINKECYFSRSYSNNGILLSIVERIQENTMT